MNKSVFHVILIFLLISIILETAVQFNAYAQTSEPAKLKIYVGPTKVLADNKAYEIIFVQLVDSKDKPARASESITIYLSSSQTHIGSVDPTIIVPKGATYAAATFYSTYTPGTTTITATAPGFATVQASITTVGPVPSKLAVYCLPPVLPADGRAYEAVIVQLQDSAGTPAKAPIGDVNVTLSSSNVTVGTVTPYITIKAGSTFAAALFITNNTGSATITAMASGYASGQATIKTEQATTEPVKLKVYVGPLKVPAEGITYDVIAVQLQDLKGRIAVAPENLVVDLSSSDTAIGTVNPTIAISQGETYSTAKLHSTYRSGTTVVTAAAPDYESSQASITTVGPVPTKLAVFCVPSNLPSDGKSYEAVVVQLQDSSGTPAKDPVGDVTINLFSSKPEIGDVDSEIRILYGETHSAAKFHSTFTAGSTTITAQAPGYTAAQATMTTSLIDQYTLRVSATANPDPVNSGEQTTIRIYVTYDGLSPAPGATVKLASDKGGNFSSVTDERNGYYMCIFTAPKVTKQTLCTISINASKTGYTSGNGSLQVTISPSIRTGDLEVYVKDSEGNPVEGVNVISTSQPSGINPLTGTTNAQGYVVFKNIPEGDYILQISKDGYETKTESITITANQTTTYTTEISKVAGGPATDFASSLWIIGIIIAVVIGVVAVIFIIRERSKTTPTLF
jgi:hypothetical protein